MDKPPKISQAVKTSFSASYLILMGYTFITLVEALRTKNTTVRHIMNLETTISIVAGLTYGLFLDKIKDPTINLNQITQLRYVDWSITTPMILLALILFYNPEKAIDYRSYLTLVLLNAGMLGAGYLGETGAVSKNLGGSIGFLFFAALLFALNSCCIPRGSSMVIFIMFSIIWTFYGIAYYLDEEKKNISYNILDVISKAIFGIVLWMYFGNVLDFDSK
jgi:bacteriorhodopsin